MAFPTRQPDSSLFLLAFISPTLPLNFLLYSMEALVFQAGILQKGGIRVKEGLKGK